MRRLLVLSLVLSLAGAGSALAGRGDPQMRITPADQARAKSMLVRAGDVGRAFASRPTPPEDSSFYCAALDESNLTLTGEAASPIFTSTAEFVLSRSYVYESRADASASWQKGVSAAGQKCLRDALVGEFQGTPARLVSFRQIAFPAVSPRSLVYRVVAAQQGIRLYLDFIALQHGRAQVAILYGTGLAPPPAGEERRLARLVVRRMVKAMQGAS